MAMFNMGGGELILISIAALLLIPPKKLPEVATSLGRLMAQLQNGISEVKRNVQISLIPPEDEKKSDKTKS